MPLAYAGHCYTTAGDALEAFQNTFPVVGDVQWTWHMASSITEAGALSYQVQTRTMANNNLYSRTGTIYLAECATPDVADFDPAAAGGVFAFFFLGVAGAWLLSKNIGLILEGIKKW